MRPLLETTKKEMKIYARCSELVLALLVFEHLFFGELGSVLFFPFESNMEDVHLSPQLSTFDKSDLCEFFMNGLHLVYVIFFRAVNFELTI